LLLHNFGILGSRDSDPIRDAEHVTIDGKAGDPECVSEDDVGGFASDPRKTDQFAHRARDLTPMFLDDFGGHSEKRSGLRTEEPGGLDLRLEFIGGGLCERGGVRISLEERRRDPIDALVSALRRKDGRNEQVVRCREIQFRVGVGVLTRELRHDPSCVLDGLRWGGLSRGGTFRHAPIVPPAPFFVASGCC